MNLVSTARIVLLTGAATLGALHGRWLYSDYRDKVNAKIKIVNEAPVTSNPKVQNVSTESGPW